MIGWMNSLFEPCGRKLFSWSVYIAGFLFGASLLIDFIWGEQVFQRTGALVVGFAVLHTLEVQRCTSVMIICDNYVAKQNPLERFVKPSDAVDVEQFVATGRRIAAIDKMAKGFMRGQSIDEASAHKISVGYVDSVIRSYQSKAKHERFKVALETREVALAVAGTLVWAFGDWVTNFLFHCGWIVSC